MLHQPSAGISAASAITVLTACMYASDGGLSRKDRSEALSSSQTCAFRSSVDFLSELPSY